MNPFLIGFRSFGSLVLGIAAVLVATLPRDLIINSIHVGTAQNQVPLTSSAEMISSIITFMTGSGGGFVLYLVGGRASGRTIRKTRKKEPFPHNRGPLFSEFGGSHSGRTL